ncbi:MAG: hypothetical protein JSW00_11020 [Thermoplasmata archaeon]|nr:MAG: hypothetical protein JSW00_11020 [Thermoplasmata archaeon]
MKPRIIEDEKGQSAFFDAIIFLVIMIIASSLIHIYSSHFSKDVDLIERQDMIIYNRQTAEVVLAATLHSTWYEDINGEIITKPPGDTTVLNLIIEELYLMDDGVPKWNFVMGYEKDIKKLIGNLILSSYHFALQGYYLNETKNEGYSIFISDIVPNYDTKDKAQNDKTDYIQMIPRDNLATIQMTLPMVGKSGEAKITFSLWF